MKKTILAATILLVVSQPSILSAVDYGDFSGTSVMYLDVTESNATDSPKFGAPDIFGNQLDFRPTEFRAQTDGDTVTEQSELSFTIMSNSPDTPIGLVMFDEAGDYTLSGLGAAQAEASVTANVRMTVTEVGGQALDPVCTDSAQMAFSPNANGTFTLPSDQGTAMPWEGMLDYDVDALLASCGVTGHATKVEVVVDNTLTAMASDGGAAFIAKKDFSGLSVTVPEPSSVGLMFGALLSIGFVRRRLTR